MWWHNHGVCVARAYGSVARQRGHGFIVRHDGTGDIERCIYCSGTAITRKGRRQKKHETIQLWYCHACERVFTPQLAKGKTYPLTVILESLMLYYQTQ